jgi:hypothetical protein
MIGSPRSSVEYMKVYSKGDAENFLGRYRRVVCDDVRSFLRTARDDLSGVLKYPVFAFQPEVSDLCARLSRGPLGSPECEHVMGMLRLSWPEQARDDFTGEPVVAHQAVDFARLERIQTGHGRSHLVQECGTLEVRYHLGGADRNTTHPAVVAEVLYQWLQRCVQPGDVADGRSPPYELPAHVEHDLVRSPVPAISRWVERIVGQAHNADPHSDNQ